MQTEISKNKQRQKTTKAKNPPKKTQSQYQEQSNKINKSKVLAPMKKWFTKSKQKTNNTHTP